MIRTLRIRLRRMGKKKSPFYRVVVSDSREAVDGQCKEILGHYDPLRRVPVKLELERLEWWMERGARPSQSVLRLMDLAKKDVQNEEFELTADETETTAENEETDTLEQTEEETHEGAD